MTPPRKPEVFISATSADLRSCRQLVKDALLTLGCVPVEQTNFPPDHRSVREMLRARVAACDAVVHLAGEVYGAEPKERAPGEPRRSYTQLEYDLARELKKPLYVFVCGEDFPYDEHAPEAEDQRALQQAHRATLLASESLRYRVASPTDLGAKVRELQTNVDHLSHELQKTHSQFQRWVVVASALMVLLCGILWWMRGQSRSEVGEIRKLLKEQMAVTKAMTDKLAPTGTGAREGEQMNPALAAQAAVAAERGVSVDALRKQLAQEGADVRRILLELENRPAGSGSEVIELKREALATLAGNAAASGNQAEAVKARRAALAITPRASEPEEWASLQNQLGVALTNWGNTSSAPDAASHFSEAVTAFRAALEVRRRETVRLEWATTRRNLSYALRALAGEKTGDERSRLLSESVAVLRDVPGEFTAKFDYPTWAETQHSLARALLAQADFTTGSERVALRAQAIATYRAAHQGAGSASLFGDEWALIRNGLGLALLDQAHATTGLERATLLTEAIAAFRDAPKIWTRDHAQKKWATAKSNLGDALLARADCATPMERWRFLSAAVEAYYEALEVRTREADPAGFAVIHLKLAGAYCRKLDDVSETERIELFAKEISEARAVLDGQFRTARPRDWAWAQNRLGNVLRQQALLSSGTDRLRILVDAAGAYRAAMEINRPEARSIAWAVNQGNLARVLREQAEVVGTVAERIRLLDEAIVANQAALEVNQRHAHPEEWAWTQDNLGKALLDRAALASGLERERVLADATAAFRSSLELRTREAAPDDWAESQSSLADTLRRQAIPATGDKRTTLLREALVANRAAVEIFTAEAYPERHRIESARLKEIEAELKNLTAVPPP